jgi:hypothetical protein
MDYRKCVERKCEEEILLRNVFSYLVKVEQLALFLGARSNKVGWAAKLLLSMADDSNSL